MGELIKPVIGPKVIKPLRGGGLKPDESTPSPMEIKIAKKAI